jgi:eukaryotic-like serine/threonine-protein kinase
MNAFADALRDRYVLDRELGRGGMAVVYLARDVKHERPVALKVLNPELASSLGPERFQREIRLAASLQHPHVLSVHDSGQTEGRLWFTMPYVRGESLRERLRRQGQLPLAEAIRITLEAAQGIAEAHRERIVHRDVKPENILLTQDGFTMVADFGIARALDGPPDQELTVTGLAIGTPKYMAPEQLTGIVDARTDQYALGATCFEMLAGIAPFGVGGLQPVSLRRPIDAVPSLRARREDVPPGIERALERALAFDPEARFPSIAEFANALTAGADADVPTRLRATSRPGWRPIAIGIVGAIVVAGLALLSGSRAGLWSRPSPTGGSSAASVEPSVRRVAVLPFENQGDAGDSYFADGMADEVRGKLSAVPGLEVIARVSSSQYAVTRKTPQQIRDELGVAYILTGTVRWEKRPGAANRVRVSPELVDTRSGVTRWQQSFDTTLTDVFEVQADIADKVARALNVTLGDAARHHLAAKPTSNLDAYTRYLHGKELRLGDSSPDAVRKAIAEFRQAVRLDPSFAAAWAHLGLAHIDAFRSGGLLASDKQAAEDAMKTAVRLAPDAPETHLLSARYQDLGLGNQSAALAEYRAGLAVAPGFSELLRGTAGLEMKLGMLDDAVTRLEHVARVDPRSPDGQSALGSVYMRLGRYADAMAALDRARALRPDSVAIAFMRARLAAARGDLNGVRAELRALEPTVGRRRIMAYVALRERLLFALDDEQQRAVLDLTPADLDGGEADWALALAETSWLRGEAVQARSYGETAVAAWTRLLDTWGSSADREQVMILRAYSLAYAGKPTIAVAGAERALAFERQLGLKNAYLPFVFARICVLAGRHDQAIDQLEEVLRRRDDFSRAWMRIDGTLAPLRNNARFMRLVSDDKAVVARE